MTDAELIPRSPSRGLASTTSDKRNSEDPLKSEQSAGQELDEYGGSTDEEPADVQDVLPPGQISTFERSLENVCTGETR